ncbi:hypothetical protein Cgig2_026681 [Carnegiea gigantea]|uniref:Uncharacterized protein n=1 Tax=Carnegiea gigantea TaxID=171969 RepID=A0A9Q1JYM6_9CARY|nr:hypothetical protein Cgig2_026681 [Carnegiea gigantea]
MYVSANLDKENRKSLENKAEMLACHVCDLEGRLRKNEDIPAYSLENYGEGVADHQGGMPDTMAHMDGVDEDEEAATLEQQEVNVLAVEEQLVEMPYVEQPGVEVPTIKVSAVEVPDVEQVASDVSCVEGPTMAQAVVEVPGGEQPIVGVPNV